MTNVLEFFVKMKDMMSGGLAKMSGNSQRAFSQIQDGIDKTVRKNKELADSFDGVEKKARGSFMSIGSIIKGTLGADAIKSVLSGAMSFVTGSVGKAMEFGKTKESFKVLTGDSKKGEGLANDLNKLQQDTILGPEVFKAAQTMLGFGIASEKVLPLMRTMGDISMGDADKLQSLTLAFSQMTAAGKLQGQDLLQMINAGFNPLNEISKKTGLSIGDLKQQMEKGAISAKMVEEAFMSATSKGGLFDGMMTKLAETPAGKMAQLQGQWENFQVGLGNALMPIASLLMDLAQPLINLANDYLPVITGYINDLLSYFSSLNDGSSQWGNYLAIAGEYIGIIWDGLSYVFQVTGHILKGVIDWIGHSEILKDLFSIIKDLAGGVWEFIKFIATGIQQMWDNVIKPILDGIEKAYKWVKGLFGDSNEAKVTVKSDGTLTAQMSKATSSSSVAATQVSGGKDNALSSMMKSSKADGNDVAKGISSGGPRVINISIGKMVEKIELHVGTMQEGMNNLERQIEDTFLRILNSGATVQ
jgi:tape measure domain-containing protein